MRPNLYLQLDYDTYKGVEDQLRHWSDVETSHETTDEHGRYYHKAMRLDLGSFVIEFQGPIVKEPIRDG